MVPFSSLSRLAQHKVIYALLSLSGIHSDFVSKHVFTHEPGEATESVFLVLLDLLNLSELRFSQSFSSDDIETDAPPSADSLLSDSTVSLFFSAEPRNSATALSSSSSAEFAEGLILLVPNAEGETDTASSFSDSSQHHPLKHTRLDYVKLEGEGDGPGFLDQEVKHHTRSASVTFEPDASGVTDHRRLFDYFEAINQEGLLDSKFKHRKVFGGELSLGEPRKYLCLGIDRVNLRYVYENFLLKCGYRYTDFSRERLPELGRLWRGEAKDQKAAQHPSRVARRFKAPLGSHTRILIGGFFGGMLSSLTPRSHPLINAFLQFLSNSRFSKDRAVFEAFETTLNDSTLYCSPTDRSNLPAIKQAIINKFVELCSSHKKLGPLYEAFWQECGLEFFNQEVERNKPLSLLAEEYRSLLSNAPSS